jgi:hypothetical protein
MARTGSILDMMDTDDETPDELEVDDVEDFGGDDLAPPTRPAPPRAGGAATYGDDPEPPSEQFVELARQLRSTPDRLEQGAMMFDILSASMADVLTDATLSPVDRRRELRTISAAAAKVFPLKEMHEAIAKIDAFNAQVERRAARAGVELEAAPAAPRAKVIPIRGSAVPDGRP